MVPPPRLPSLAELSRDAAEGDPKALEQFLAELHPILRRYAARVFGEDRDLPSDIAQEALIRIAMGLPQARAETEDQIIAWSLTIVRNLCIDWWRRLLLEPCHSAASAIGYSVANPPENANGMKPELQHLIRILCMCEAELPEDTRRILYLRLIEGAPWSEVGRELKLKPTAVKRRYQRAQRTLRRRVLQYVSALSGPLRTDIIDQMRQFGVEVVDDPE